MNLTDLILQYDTQVKIEGKSSKHMVKVSIDETTNHQVPVPKSTTDVGKKPSKPDSEVATVTPKKKRAVQFNDFDVVID